MMATKYTAYFTAYSTVLNLLEGLNLICNANPL